MKDEISSFASVPFGELLRILRKRQGIRQQTLAAQPGVHRNTIGVWERGECLPESKTMVLELARQLHLDEQETRMLLVPSETGGYRSHRVPERASYFRDRSADYDCNGGVAISTRPGRSIY